MIKVHILTRCKRCNGEAFILEGEVESYTGETYMRYVPCPVCQGTGNQAERVDLLKFTELLNDAAPDDPMQPDWLELAHHMPASEYQDSCDAAGI